MVKMHRVALNRGVESKVEAKMELELELEMELELELGLVVDHPMVDQARPRR